MSAARTWLILGLASSLFSCVGKLGENKDGASGDDGPPPIAGGSCTEAQVGAPVLRRLSVSELESSLRDIFPEVSAQWAGVQLGPDPLSKQGFTNDVAGLQVGDQTAKELLQTAEDIATLVTAPATLTTVLPCAASQPGPDCAGQFITKYGLRLFRRPVSDGEKNDFLSLFTSVSAHADFGKAIKWTLVSMIQSPLAVYRSEIGALNSDRYELSQYEIATELAYNFSGTTPDQELLDKAGRGELSSPEALVDEAKRLLATPRGKDLLHDFLNQWIGYEQARTLAKTSVPNFNHIGGLMAQETERFLDEIIYTKGAGVRELLTAPYTFVNAELAQFYGFGGGSGDFQKMDRPADRGIGLLAQGSLLAGTSHMDGTSPTYRGLLVYKRLTCHDVPPPPKDIKPVDKPDPGRVTTRDRFEKLHASADGCKACHGQWDPSGFALEHFDEAGRFRADEGGLAINDSGSVLIDSKQIPVQGEKELAEALASSPAVAECISGLAATYAYGGVLGAPCAIDTAQKGLVSEQYGLLEYYARLATTEHMRYRVRRE